MGKKSKRKSTNKSSPCYHGCITKKDFNFGGHYKILEDWSRLGLIIEDGETYKPERIDEFYEKNKIIMDDPTFGNFVIAHITDDFLKGKNTDLLLKLLLLLLNMRYVYIPRNEGKDVGPDSEYAKNRNKYMRDILTERGRIKCMAREIPCKCMEAKRIEAQSMDKVASCWCCKTDFPKQEMLRCKCNHVQYCSKECSKNHWPKHKKSCTKYNVSSATASTSASVPSSFEKPSDVDAEEE